MTLGAMISDMKYRARDRLTGLWGRAIAILIIMFLLALGVNMLTNTLLAAFEAPFSHMFTWNPAQGGLQVSWPQRPTSDQLLAAGAYFGVMLAMSLVSALISDPLAFGRTAWYERAVNGAPEGVSYLFSWYEGGRRYGKAFAVSLLYRLKIFLWSLLFAVPAAVLCVIGGVLFSMDTIEGMRSFSALFRFLGVVVVLAVAALVVLVAVFLTRYALVVYLLARDPSLRIHEAFRDSVRMMKGHRWQFLLLNLSFIGWVLLIPFTLGIILLYLIPYYRATTSIFREYVIAAANHYEAPADTEPAAGEERDAGGAESRDGEPFGQAGAGPIILPTVFKDGEPTAEFRPRRPRPDDTEGRTIYSADMDAPGGEPEPGDKQA